MEAEYDTAWKQTDSGNQRGRGLSREAGKPLRIGTRGSELALWQAREVERRLQTPSTIVVIKTEGDKRRDIALQGTSSTGFFTKAIEHRLLKGEVDLAVHSLKDLPTQLEPTLEIGAVLPRAPVNDLLLVHPDWCATGDGEMLLPIKPGCVVGAGSLRRQALVRLYAQRAAPKLIRGNVPTRIQKCRDGEYGAIVIARAGVERLGLDVSPLVAWELSVDCWLPAPGQGAVAVEVRRGDERVLAALEVVDDEKTARSVELERRLLSNFEGGCHTAFGAYATTNGDGWIVDIGIDRVELGWGQARFTGDLDTCIGLGPDELRRFETPTVLEREALCRPWNLQG